MPSSTGSVDRSTSTAAATGSTPAARTASTVSSSEAPVVRMSSTIATRSSGATAQPRRSARPPSATGSANAARTSTTQLARRLEGEQHAPGGRAHHQRRSIRRKGIGQAAAQLDPEARMLEDEELLEVAPGVAPGLQEEVAVEQGAGIGEEGLDRSVAKGRIGHS